MARRRRGERRRADGRRGFWGGYATVVVKLRWLIIAFWIAVTATLLSLPTPSTDAGDLGGFGSDNPAIEAELRSFEIFGVPLLSRVVVVQHDPDGLSAFAQAEAVLRAVALTQGAYDTAILGALPVPNTFGVTPGATTDGTTFLTYLFLDPRSSFGYQTAVAEQWAEKHLTDPDDAYIGVTGSVPARAAQAEIVQHELHTLELVTVLAVLLIVGVTFRSVVAPVITLLTAGSAVLVTLGVAGRVAELLGVSIPPDLRPLIVALLLGVVTDYCIFFLSGLRHQIASGAGRLDAARAATKDFAPIVAVAGLTVATGTGTLIVAESALFRGFGPGMALTVFVGMAVAVTLVPALMAIVGGRAFWPAPPTPTNGRDPVPSVVTRAVTRPLTAALVALGCFVVLALAAMPLTRLDLGLGFVQSLPSDEPASRAAGAAAEGFAPGILSPTEILIEADGITRERSELRELGEILQRQPGVADVLGPGDAPPIGEFNVLLARSGDAARFLVVLDSEPLEATAINAIEQLRQRMPALLGVAGLRDARVSMAGDTALAEGIVAETSNDLLRISVAALAANLFMLVVFLRALVAPLYLLATNLLALCATLGVTVWVFQDLLGQEGLTFYVPFAAAVLLVSLGSDYNIFAVGHIWSLASRRPLRQAIAVAVPQSTRAITSAGAALAVSFGLLALVPLRPFRELAFALAFGIVVDVLIVRALLVPSLLTVVGPVSGWPSKALRRRRVVGDRPEDQFGEQLSRSG
ncbi:MAG: MMPL family transporter [Actinomycetes bacterium]